MMYHRHKRENYWISLSDIMTGLSVIFMFISISYIIQVKKPVKRFRDTQFNLYQELKLEFEEDFREDNWNASLDNDLTIRFLDEKVLFDYNRTDVKPEFRKVLDDFFPRYLKILLKPEYQRHVVEVRIEGHTDSVGSYLSNIILSQGRTVSVLKYLIDSTDSFSFLNPEDKRVVQFWMTANGFSFGRTLDTDGSYTLVSGKEEDPAKSRRVEFRILTRSEQVINEMISDND
ncbi:MAG: OmpA family protein [Candidatus Muiribacteriaceae bacterium]